MVDYPNFDLPKGTFGRGASEAFDWPDSGDLLDLDFYSAASGGPVSYSLTCVVGSYAKTGVAATLSYAPGSAGVNYSLTCITGSYVATGVSAAEVYGRKQLSSAGTYALAGVDSVETLGRKLLSSAGTYALTGVSATEVYGRKLLSSSGSYALTGVSATEVYGRKLASSSGAYSLAGVAAALTYSPGSAAIAYTLTGAVGSYASVGIATTQRVGRGHSATAGAYVVSGVSATLSYGPGGGATNYTLTPSTGSYTYTGKNARATIGVDMIVQPDTATIASQIIAALSVTPIPANTVQMQGSNVIGSGTATDPWRNASTGNRPYIKP